jgi:hypothetical protein
LLLFIAQILRFTQDDKEGDAFAWLRMARGEVFVLPRLALNNTKGFKEKLAKYSLNND